MDDLKELFELSKDFSDEQLRFIILIETSNFFTSSFVKGYRMSKNFDIRIIVDELVRYVKTGEIRDINISSNNSSLTSILNKLFTL